MENHLTFSASILNSARDSWEKQAWTHHLQDFSIFLLSLKHPWGGGVSAEKEAALLQVPAVSVRLSLLILTSSKIQTRCSLRLLHQVLIQDSKSGLKLLPDSQRATWTFKFVQRVKP